MRSAKGHACFSITEEKNKVAPMGLKQVPVVENSRMVDLDPHEKAAVEEFLAMLKDELVEAKASPQLSQIWRGAEGQIILPVSADPDGPSLTLALLASQKAERIYKATSTRILCVQKPLKDPKGFTYVWKDEAWSTL